MGIGREGLLKNEDGLMRLFEITERVLLYRSARLIMPMMFFVRLPPIP